MSKPIPQEAIDSLPDGYTLLGWGWDFETKGMFDGLALDSAYSDSTWTVSQGWIGNIDSVLYAAPDDSEIVELNRKASKLPDLSRITPSTSDKNLTKKPHKELMQKAIYIAGPMRGKQYFNFPAFDEARDMWTERGWKVVSPADIDREHGFDALEMAPDSDWSDLSVVPFSIQDCFDRDMAAIRNQCSAIYMLKGWQNSTGAQAEYWAAKWLDLDIYYEEESICEEAYRIQGGDRQQDYGDPTQNFQDIANLWNAYFRMNLHQIDMQARDVAHMMILMKIARNCHKAKRDNWVDIAGYSQCGGKIDKV